MNTREFLNILHIAERLKDILRDTIDKIESEKPDIQNFMVELDRLQVFLYKETIARIRVF